MEYSCIFTQDLIDIKLTDFSHLIYEFNRSDINNSNTLLNIKKMKKNDDLKIVYINYFYKKSTYLNVDYYYNINKPLNKYKIHSIFNNSISPKHISTNVIKSKITLKKDLILIAEDNKINQKVMLNIIKKHGYVADIACNGKEVIEMIKKKKYSLIFMDCHMPEMDGFECTKLIRLEEQDTKLHISIVALTGGVSLDNKKECIDCGMDNFLTKPVSSDEVLTIIKKFLGTCFSTLVGGADPSWGSRP